jgi:hypothetical protein
VWPQQFNEMNRCGRTGSDERHGKEALTE